MILPDPNQSDIPIDVSPKTPHLPHPYFRQLAAIVSVFVLTAGLGLAVKLAQNNQNPFTKAGGGIDFVDLVVSNNDLLRGLVSFYPDGSIKAGDKPINLSALAFSGPNSPIWENLDYQWGVSSTNSIGQLEVNSTDPKVVKFIPNGNSGRVDIWVVVNGGVKASYAVVSGPFVPAVAPLTPTPTPTPTPYQSPTPSPLQPTPTPSPFEQLSECEVAPSITTLNLIKGQKVVMLLPQNHNVGFYEYFYDQNLYKSPVDNFGNAIVSLFNPYRTNNNNSSEFEIFANSTGSGNLMVLARKTENLSDLFGGYCKQTVYVKVDTSPTPTPTPTPTITPRPTPTPTPLASCNSACNNNNDCPANTLCYMGSCRNPMCVTSSSCICSSPVPTPTPTPYPWQAVNIRLNYEGMNERPLEVTLLGQPNHPDAAPVKLGSIQGYIAQGLIAILVPSEVVGQQYFLYIDTPSHLRKYLSTTTPTKIVSSPMELDFGQLTPGDIYRDVRNNKDQLVNTFDVSDSYSQWSGASDIMKEGRVPADLNGDGVVNNRDLALMLENFGRKSE